MKKVLLVSMVIILCFSLMLASSAKTAAETFIKFIEAEDCTLSGYTVVDGNKGSVGKMINSDTAKEDTFTVKFTAPADGQYTIWFKVWHVSQGDNSVLYNYNGEELVFDFDEDAGVENPDYFMLNRWYWIEINYRGTEPLENGFSAWGEANNSVRHSPVKLEFKKGDNEITFTSREAGHFIDQIIVTDNLDYNPADVAGNETYVCTFCNLNHFKLEPFEDFGKTPEQYWNEKLAAEATPADTQTSETQPAETQTAQTPETTKTPAAQTADLTSVLVVILAAAAATAFVSKKR